MTKTFKACRSQYMCGAYCTHASLPKPRHTPSPGDNSANPHKLDTRYMLTEWWTCC